jgi:ketosteroid isomerase-like protein
VTARRFEVTDELLVSRSYAGFNERDPRVILPLYRPDCRWLFRHFAGWPEDQEYHGHDGLVRLFGDFLTAWGEFKIAPLGLWRTDDDLWFIHCRMSATGASSGVPLELDFWQVCTLVDRKIDLVDNYTDRDEALAAAGLSEADL